MPSKLDRHAEQLSALGHPVRLAILRFVVQAGEDGTPAGEVVSTDDVLEAKTRFEAEGLATFSEEDTTCCYAVQDKVWVEDPDGIALIEEHRADSWEVFVVKGDAPVMKADASSCCAPVGIARKPMVAGPG